MQAATPEARLLKFDRWVKEQLGKRIDWAWAGTHREKRIEQCRVHLEKLVLEMWRRGWMLDGERLARHIEAVLDSIGTYQKTGKVLDFWPYFRACVDRYVGANAEEISAESMRAGAHLGQMMKTVLTHASRQAPTLPELVAQRAGEVAQAKAETLREKLARERARVKPAEATLPGF